MAVHGLSHILQVWSCPPADPSGASSGGPDAFGDLAAAEGDVGTGGERDIFVGDLDGDRVGRGGGERIEPRGTGVIFPGLNGLVTDVPVLQGGFVVPVGVDAKGSGAVRRGGMLVAGEVEERVENGGRPPMGGSSLPAPPMGGRGLPPKAGRGLVVWNGGGCGPVAVTGVGRTGLGFGTSLSSPAMSSCDDCGVPFLGNTFPPAGPFPFPPSVLFKEGR